MKWWMRNNLRLIQNNLRETDASCDIDLLVQRIVDFGANALMLNTGGVAAFYPTELEHHYKSPYLTGDLIGEAVKKCHEKGVKFFARFDFSKVHESIYPEKPEWFYVSPAGETCNYNGMVHTCICGEYQQSHSLKIIEEVLDRYPVDGIFFNMFGFVTKDYSNRYIGICQCESCKVAFKDMFDMELPQEEDPSDPAHEKYQEFKSAVVRKTLENIRRLVDGKGREIAISNYTDYCVDIMRRESNTEIHRPYPLWQYSASENCQSIESTWDDKIASNISINAVGLDYRFMGVSEADTKVRLYQNIAAGSGLDFCIIGIFEGYPDAENFEAVKKIYHFHRDNEEHFGKQRAKADVMLVKPSPHGTEEYFGIYKMLKEEHLQFDAAGLSNLEAAIRARNGYKAIILPDTPSFSKGQRDALRLARENGVSIVATGKSFMGSKEDEAFLKAMFGAKPVAKDWNARWAYLDVSENRGIYKSYPKRDWIFIDGNFPLVEYAQETHLSARLISAGRFGPPERCGGNEKTDRFAVAIGKECGAPVAHLPWQPGWMYQRYGYEAHKRLFIDVLEHLVGDDWILKTNAPANVELSFGVIEPYEMGEKQRYILHVINLSGYNGMAFFPPNEIHGLKVEISGLDGLTWAKELESGQPAPFKANGRNAVFELKPLGAYACIVMG
ncbi:MAG: hypothetical protein LBU32_28695 [Clostridiales bacterium]|nr:hypothetical protein [Clostridiales bacterium]